MTILEIVFLAWAVLVTVFYFYHAVSSDNLAIAQLQSQLFVWKERCKRLQSRHDRIAAIVDEDEFDDEFDDEYDDEYDDEDDF